MADEWREDFEALYEDAPCGYATTKADGRILRVNRTLLNWLELDRADVQGKLKFQELISVGDRIFYETHLSPLLQMRGGINEINLALKPKNGGVIPVLCTAGLSRGEDSAPDLIRFVFYNITDRKRYESDLLFERKRAEVALRSKAEFVSLLTHEIRTPLNSIIGASHLLADTQLSDEQRRFSEMLASSSENLMNLLNSILDFSKMDSGKSRLAMIPFEFRRSLRDVVLGLQGRATHKGLELNLEIDSRIPERLVGDAVKIGQMLTNLIGNAIKFTDEGRVSVEIERLTETEDDVEVRFLVADTGIGIESDQLSSIFDEYSQSEANAGKAYGGTGLGLAISQKIAELYGSQISVRSELGRGSSFTFVLRLGRVRREHLKVETKLPPEVLRGKRVLVADDSADNRELLALIMKKWGLEITFALDGREVMGFLARQTFDLVLMDLRMPIMNGYETVTAIRESDREEIAHLPVIAFSASATIGDNDVVGHRLFDDLLGKPFRPADLFAKMARLLAPT